MLQIRKSHHPKKKDWRRKGNLTLGRFYFFYLPNKSIKNSGDRDNVIMVLLTFIEQLLCVRDYAIYFLWIVTFFYFSKVYLFI